MILFLSAVLLALNLVSQFLIAGYQRPEDAFVGSGIQLLLCVLCLLLSGSYAWNVLAKSQYSKTTMAVSSFVVLNLVNVMAALSPISHITRIF